MFTQTSDDRERIKRCGTRLPDLRGFHPHPQPEGSKLHRPSRRQHTSHARSGSHRRTRKERHMTQQSPPQPVQNPLTLVMTAKSSQDYAALRQIIKEIQSLPPDKNPITTALTNLANVHFARFVFLDNNQL